MEAQLVKRQDRFDLYNESDGSKIASTLKNPMGKLSLKNCQAIENGYDLDELSWKFFPYHEWEYSNGSFGDINEENRETFKIGFQKALEILGDKKFSESNLRIGCSSLLNLEKEEGELSEVFTEKQYRHIDTYIQSLQQTEWDVFFNPDEKDSEGCLILKSK